MSPGSGCAGCQVQVTLAAAASPSWLGREGALKAHGPVISLKKGTGGWPSQPLPLKGFLWGQGAADLLSKATPGMTSTPMLGLELWLPFSLPHRHRLCAASAFLQHSVWSSSRAGLSRHDHYPFTAHLSTHQHQHFLSYSLNKCLVLCMFVEWPTESPQKPPTISIITIIPILQMSCPSSRVSPRLSRGPTSS